MDRSLFPRLRWHQVIACTFFACAAGAALGAGAAKPAVRAAVPAAQVQSAPQAVPQGLSLQELTDRLDQLDQLDLQDALEKAAACTRREDFDCAANEIAKARRVANSSADRKNIEAAQVALADARSAVAVRKDRERVAEQQRQLAELKRRNREEEEETTVYDSGPGLPSFQEQSRQIANIHNQAMANFARMQRQRQQEQAAGHARESSREPVRSSSARQTSREESTRVTQNDRLARSVQQDFERLQAQRRGGQRSSSSETTAGRVGSPATGSGSFGSAAASSPPQRPVYAYRKTESIKHSSDTWRSEAEARADVMREVDKRRGPKFGGWALMDFSDPRIRKEIVQVGTPTCKSYQLAGGVLNWWCNVEVEIEMVSHNRPGEESSGAGVSR